MSRSAAVASGIVNISTMNAAIVIAVRIIPTILSISAVLLSSCSFISSVAFCAPSVLTSAIIPRIIEKVVQQPNTIFMTESMTSGMLTGRFGVTGAP